MYNKILRTFKELINVRDGAEDKRTIIENIKDDSDLGSARLWTLIFAIGIASVGLNINSIPVIIGAMLISPLMGPVVSVGLSLAIYDWGLMRRSLSNFLVLTLIAITFSSLYFFISPISNAQSELLARIQPTIFDVIIAMFGGMAGFIGISRARHSNVIPGVAIATALMPPLCTVGYGIGTWQPTFVFGALYLFSINCIFICISSLLIAKYFKLPKHEYPDEEQKKRVNRIITAIILVVTIPAVYFAYSFVEQNTFTVNAERYIQEVLEEDNIVVYRSFNYSPVQTSIEVAFLDGALSQSKKEIFERRLSEYGLSDTTLIVQNGAFDDLQNQNDALISNMINTEERLSRLEARIALLQHDASYDTHGLLLEIQAFETRVRDITIERNHKDTGSASLMGSLAVTLTVDESLPTEVQSAIIKWLAVRLVDDSLIVEFLTEEITKEAE